MRISDWSSDVCSSDLISSLFPDRFQWGILVRPGHGKILNLAVMTSINPVERVCEHSDHKGPCTSQRKHGALDDRLSRTITAWPWSQMVANLCCVSRSSLTAGGLAKGFGGDPLFENPAPAP